MTMRNALAISVVAWTASAGVAAQQSRPVTPPHAIPVGTAGSPSAVVGAGYVIGIDDVLTIVFWRDKDLSGDVTVRPDGKISVPLLNEMPAAGMTPEQLRQSLETAAARYLEDPNATVIVKTVNSRKVYVTGQVTRPGSYPLNGPTTVLQALSLAGGVLEYADAEDISVMRVENGKTVSLKFNYKDVIRRKKMHQNIELRPGDTIVVP